MKKISFLLLLIVLVINLTAQSVWDGNREAIRNGSGTEDDPYLIENAQQLAWFVYTINWDYATWTNGKYFLLTTDIDLNGSRDNQWIPIGAGVSVLSTKGFNGVFDGGFHKITGLYIDDHNPILFASQLWYGTKSAAFFAKTGYDAIVKNLYVEGSINIPNNRWAAGISCEHGSYEYCVSNVDIESTKLAGGVVTSGRRVSCSANLGNVKGPQYIGGIMSRGTSICIENCYNVGRIEADDYVGGIIGYGGRLVKNCYNVGEIAYGENAEHKGGIAGFCEENVVVNSYYLEDCIAESNEYGEPASADFMRSMEFVNLLNNDTDVWIMDTINENDGYPIFGNTPFGIEEILSEFKDLVVIYPNPVVDYVNIVGDVVSCDVFDLVGKRVFSISTNINKIAVTNLPSGIYVMRFLTKNGNVVTKKIVKK